LFEILLPLLKPVLATVLLFTMVGHWNEFFQGMVLSTQETSYPLQTYIQQLVVATNLQNLATLNVEQINRLLKLNNESLNAAKIFIAMIPVLIVYPFLQRYFVKGITLGSVKG
jgi:multiple sugar transport system permease protein/putative aldouronate transport system permease protein